MSRLWRRMNGRRKVENRAVFCWTRNRNFVFVTSQLQGCSANVVMAWSQKISTHLFCEWRRTFRPRYKFCKRCRPCLDGCALEISRQFLWSAQIEKKSPFKPLCSTRRREWSFKMNSNEAWVPLMKVDEIFSKTQPSLSMNWKWSDHHICSVYYICSSGRSVCDR